MSFGTMVVVGGSLNPPGVHHKKIAKTLAKNPKFDIVLIVPCGLRPDKEHSAFVAPDIREQMVRATFTGIKNVWMDFSDITSEEFTRTIDLDRQIRYRYEPTELWHFVGSDLIVGGRAGQSQIQLEWVCGQELWHCLNFVISQRPGYPISGSDLPPKHLMLEESFPGSSTEIRQQAAYNRQFHKLVVPQVAHIIASKRLFGYQ